MSTPHPMVKHSLLQEIHKAFEHVNKVCEDYFESKKIITAKKESTKKSHRNFNHYKNNDKSAETLSPSSLKKNAKESINLIEDESNNISENLIKPQKAKEKVIVTVRGNSQTGGKYALASKVPEAPQIPLPPKAPLSPYFTFYKEKKDLIKEEFPDMSITELASAAAKVWKSLNEDEKGPYNKKYFEEKREYEQNMAEYVKKYPNYKDLLKNTKGAKK